MGARQRLVRCRACGRKALQGLAVCPHCGRDPAAFHTRWRPTLVSLLAGVVAGIALFAAVPGLLPLSLPAEPTPAPPVAVARRPTFTPTPTATPRPTATPTITPTPEPTATTTPTPRVVVTVATSTPTITPRPTLPPLRITAPKDGTEYGGGDDTEIILQWEGIILEEGQQYAVTLRFINRAEATETRGYWVRTNFWRADPRITREINLTLRALKWDVAVIDGTGAVLSAPSESRIFYWR